jgi:hypothetical protein
MKNKKGSGQGFLSLFNGNIRGSVINPYTGTVMSRREVLELYRYLVVKHLDDPSDDWAIEMLLHTRELLGIPMDLHFDLVEELKRIDRSKIPHTYKRPILEEVETIRLFREGFVHGGAERSTVSEEVGKKEVKEISYDLRSDIMEMEEGSLLNEMEGDEIDLGEDSALSNGYRIEREPSVMGDMLSGTKKRPKKP